MNCNAQFSHLLALWRFKCVGVRFASDFFCFSLSRQRAIYSTDHQHHHLHTLRKKSLIVKITSVVVCCEWIVWSVVLFRICQKHGCLNLLTIHRSVFVWMGDDFIHPSIHSQITNQIYKYIQCHIPLSGSRLLNKHNDRHGPQIKRQQISGTTQNINLWVKQNKNNHTTTYKYRGTPHAHTRTEYFWPTCIIKPTDSLSLIYFYWHEPIVQCASTK